MTDTHPPAMKQGHGMPCPVCGVDLVMTDRQGIEIDYCPKCRGVWLDRGELDKIIERGSGHGSSSQASVYGRHEPFAREPSGRGSRHDDVEYRHRKKSWLHDLFD